MTNPLINVEGLWKIFASSLGKIDMNNSEQAEQIETDDAVKAVKDVSFTVNRGEVFVIMGLSGSGKSTLIRCLIRLIEPTCGRILINGTDVAAMGQEELIDFRRKSIAMVFQHYGLLPHRTVLENVEFGLKLRGERVAIRKEKAAAVIEQVGLSGWEKKYPAQLSGGMQQRVGIARALVQESDVLLMDEPFSGLDPLIRREMQDELIRLQREMHKTIIFVTHDLNEAMRMGDRMAVMRQGEFVQVGQPQEIIANPADEYVERFVHDVRRKIKLAVEESRPRNVRVLRHRKPEFAAAGGE
ncbi:MAG: quaternary amine ABC transporter ATP-binding protein [Syntrophomonadaceae bacterium]|jgi:glycine betaine/proline transport system ATP-binding protein